ncbi:MAG: stalk domain-containing protein [Bacillota bacterium]|nr:stalk domain-containing protein [Bacillota bacterium]
MKKVSLVLVGMLLVFGLFAANAGDADALASMGAYNPSCDTCHGEGKQAKPLPEQKAAAPAPAPTPAPAPAPTTGSSAPSAPIAPVAPRAISGVFNKTMDFTVVGVMSGTKYTAKNSLEVKVDNGYTYIKVRDLVDMAGQYINIVDFSWDNKAKAFHIKTLANHGAIFTAKKAFEVNGVEIVPEKGAKLINNHVYVPVRAFIEALGGSVHYDTTQGISISFPQI